MDMELHEEKVGMYAEPAGAGKRECDIIKDLLPSYVDNICSEASREWIEEHLAKCGDCRASMEVMKHTEISAKRLEQEGIDAAKKVVRKNLKRSMLNLVLCTVLIVMMIVVFETDTVQIPNLALYIAMLVCMGMTWLVCRNQPKVRSFDKWDALLAAAVVLAAGYGAVMLRYGFSQAVKGETVFGLAPNGFGPFLYGQMVLAAVLCFAAYLVQMVRTARQGRCSSLVMNLCLVGMFLMMAYCVHMGYLTDLDLAGKLLERVTVAALAVGLAGTACFVVLDKIAKK